MRAEHEADEAEHHHGHEGHEGTIIMTTTGMSTSMRSTITTSIIMMDTTMTAMSAMTPTARAIITIITPMRCLPPGAVRRPRPLPKRALSGFSRAGLRRVRQDLRAKGHYRRRGGAWIECDYVPEEYEVREATPDYTGGCV